MRLVLAAIALAVLGVGASSYSTYTFSPGSPTQMPNWQNMRDADLHHTTYYPTCRDALQQCIQVWQADYRYHDMSRNEATYHCEVQFAGLKGLCPHPMNHEVSEYLDPMPDCKAALEECVGDKQDHNNVRRTQCQKDLQKKGICAHPAPGKRDEQKPWNFPDCDSAMRTCVGDKVRNDPGHVRTLECLGETRGKGICPYPVPLECNKQNGGCVRKRHDGDIDPVGSVAPTATVAPVVVEDANKTFETLVRRTSDVSPSKPTLTPWDYSQCVPYFFDCVRLEDGWYSKQVSRRDMCCIEVVQKRLCLPGYCPDRGFF